MKTLWTLYYKWTLGESYDTTLSGARTTTTNILQSTQGKTKHFFNHKGDKIRGWQRPLIRFTNTPKHPLENKYAF